jgi:hypothetical protein
VGRVLRPALELSFDANFKILPIRGIVIGTVRTLGPFSTLTEIAPHGQFKALSDLEIFHKCREFVCAAEEFMCINSNRELRLSPPEITDVVWRTLILDVGFDS